MATRRGHLEGALGGLLAPDVRQIGSPPGRRARRPRSLDRERLVAPQVAEHLGEAARRADFDPRCEGGLVAVGLRNQRLGAAGRPGGQHQREGPVHAAQAAVERQLAHERSSDQRLRLDRARGGQDPEGNRKIQAGAALAHPRGGQADRDPPVRKPFARRGDRGADPGDALPDRRLREPDEVDPRQQGADADLDLDRDPFDAVERSADHARQARVLPGPGRRSNEGRAERTRPCLPPSKGPARAGEAFHP